MRLIGYVRVSSEGQLDGYGLDVQRKAIRAWAKTNGHTVARIEADAGISGAKDAAERPGLAAALNAIQEGQTGGLVVARLDRLARALHVQEAILAVVWKPRRANDPDSGGRVFSADQGEVLRDDPDDPMRTTIRQIVGAFAELDRKLVVKRLRDGRKAKADTGRKAVGAYAFGTMGAGKGRERDAAMNPEEHRAVMRIIELRRSGVPYRAIAHALDSEGLKPRQAALWSAMSVRAVCLRHESKGHELVDAWNPR